MKQGATDATFGRFWDFALNALTFLSLPLHYLFIIYYYVFIIINLLFIIYCYLFIIYIFCCYLCNLNVKHYAKLNT